jgi:hypothetical protein
VITAAAEVSSKIFAPEGNLSVSCRMILDASRGDSFLVGQRYDNPYKEAYFSEQWGLPIALALG